MIFKEEIVLPERSDVTQAVTPPNGHVMPVSDKAEGKALLSLILNSLDDDKAEEVVTIDLAGKSQMADYMIVASGRSSRQVSSIADKLADRLKLEAGVICRMEGKDTGDWVLVDCGDAIVHVFRPEVRDFYQLEKMWQPAAGPQSVKTDA